MKKIGLGLTLLSLLLYFGARWLPENQPTVLPPATEEPPAASAPEAASPSSFLEPKRMVKEHTFKTGDSLFGVLSVLGVSHGEMLHIVQAAKKFYDLRKIIPGQKIQVILEEAPLGVGMLVYQIDPFRALKLERADGGFHAIEEKITLDRDVVNRRGVITDTLFDSARRAGVPPEVVLDLSDIFAWDVDFSTEIQEGDEFHIVYEVFKKAGEIVRTGRVLAAEIVNQGNAYRAYYFSQAGEKGDYFDEKGSSLKKAFLKSPLRYRYISSGFTTRRFHPVLKINRPHLGIDFAAPYGTPVMAASGGTVTFVGWNGGHGKAVIIQHRNGYSTLYGHLSAYGDGMRVGKRVDQGDVVGRVGSTGLSTGPHLHYTLMKNGKPIDPKNADVVRGDPLPKAGQAQFTERVEEMNRYLDAEQKGEDRT
ncbi:MAG: M23 family metallopeptidase [Nitrospirae bacterium]|nr:M23 family metallopeptidase [Candidatus Manganitrophaceae bacterium]